MEMTLANWQPKVIGVLTAFAAFVEFDKAIHFPHWVESLANFLMIGGLAAFGFTTKQWNVTGGTQLNTKNEPSISGAPNGKHK